MRNFILSIMLALAVVMPTQKIQAQNSGAGVAAAAGALLAVGATIAAVEAAKEQTEQYAMEYVLAERPDLEWFELKTKSFAGVKAKDLSSVDFLVFEIIDFKNSKKMVLFGFSQGGFANANGVDYSKASWKMFTQSEWNDLVGSYINLASGETLTNLSNVKIVNTGVKNGGKFIIKFDKQKGDVYKVRDYSNEFKLIYNERSLGLFLKSGVNDSDFNNAGKSGLIQVRRKVIINTHEFLNNQK